MKSDKKYRLGLAAIAFVYAILAMTYLLVTPPLEASDEYKHYPVVQYIETKLSLPVLDPDNPGLWLQEGAQPPLYYLLSAAITFWIDTSDLEQIHTVNPYAFVGDPNQIRNKNLLIHDAERDNFPGQGSVLAVYLIRLASIGLGMGTIFLTYRLGRQLDSPRTGLAAAAVTAFNPMFLFVSAAVNNDSLANLLGQWGLYLLVGYWRAPLTDSPQYRSALQLGLILGLGILTKLSLGGLLGLTAIVIIWLMWQHRRIRPFAIEGAIILGIVLIVSGWWFIRNVQIYGDLTGLGTFIAVQGTRDVPITLAGWVDEFGTFFRSFWGLFGGVNIAAPSAFYAVSNTLALLGIGGLGKWIWQKRGNLPPGLWLLAAWASILMILLVRWNIIAPAFQGRLIFPALGALNILLVMGWRELAGKRGRTAVYVVIPSFFFLAAAAIPWATIRPAYAFPQPEMRIPATAMFGPVTFDQGAGKIRLVGVEMDANQTVQLDHEPVRLVLYWQAESPIEKNYLSAVHLLGRGLTSVGSVNRYPAWGMIPTSQWQPGQIWRDEYHVYVHDTAVAPAQLRLSVTVFDAEEKITLPAIWPDGARADLVLVGESVRLTPKTSSPSRPANALEVAFEQAITLAGYEIEAGSFPPGTAVDFTLYWQAAAAPAQDYTIFVQLWDAQQMQVADADGPPVNNDYPTSLWQAGDWVDDARSITLPDDLSPGSYTLRIGLYEPISGQRLQRLDGSGDFISIPLNIGFSK